HAISAFAACRSRFWAASRRERASPWRSLVSRLIVPPRANAPRYRSADRFPARDKPERLHRSDRAPAAFPQSRTQQQSVAAACCHSRSRDTTEALRHTDSILLTPEPGEISRLSNRAT